MTTSVTSAGRLAAWQAGGERLDVVGARVWTRTLGPARDATPVLVLHGFPTCSYDARRVAEALPERRFVLFDFVGYGLSDKPPEHGYSLFEQADVACQVVRHHGLSRVHVWAHDMGTSVATELLARRARGLLPFELASLVLSNGSVVVELAHLTPSQRVLRTRLGPLFARLSNEATFRAQLARIVGVPLEEGELADAWQLLVRDDGHLRLPRIIRYLEERTRFRTRWLPALDQPDLRMLIAWGEKDTVAVTAIADELARLAPHAERARWPTLGHYPQLEDPAQVAATLDAFWR
jgi:pimeloyl-ACP methyl ester carboxylesterase